MSNRQKLNFIASLLLCGLSVAFLIHFALIGIYGRQLIQEPNPAVYWLEVTFFFAPVSELEY